MQNTKGKTAFITGGASGIGFGMAKAFSQTGGMNVVIADIRQEALDEAIIYFKEKKLPVHAIQLDVTDRNAYAKAADEAESAFGKIHVLVNNAGVGIRGPLHKASFNDWDFAVDVNIKGVGNGIVTILPRILKHGEGGHVLSTSSSGGIFAVGNVGLYITTKFAVAGMMEALATDLEGTGVGASVYFPGPTNTNLPVTTESTRPERYKNSGEPEKPASPPPSSNAPKFNIDEVFMDPVEAGERILRGIKRGDLFIMTHPEFRDGIIARNEALLRALPDEPMNKVRYEALKTFGTLLKNPVYDKQTKPEAYKFRK
jgi:NADP-dependent 3-hydroxy acid dehydrogenase YdfG